MVRAPVTAPRRAGLGIACPQRAEIQIRAVGSTTESQPMSARSAGGRTLTLAGCRRRRGRRQAREPCDRWRRDAEARASPEGKPPPADFRHAGPGLRSLPAWTSPGWTCRVFIGAEIRLDVGFDAAQARLANLARGGLLRRASDDAFHDLETGLARVGPLGAAPGLSRLVAVRCTDMAVHRDFASMAIRWEATGTGGALFPALDADLKLTPAGEQATMLAVRGVYRPPLSGLGAGLDRVILHRLAQATIWAFTHQIGAVSAQPAPSPNKGASGRGQSDLSGRSPARRRPHRQHPWPLGPGLTSCLPGPTRRVAPAQFQDADDHTGNS